MHIVSHRGFWKRKSEANTKSAFQRAFGAGFGVELDVRDRDGKLVISHGMPSASAMPFADFLTLYAKKGVSQVLAINMKSDGIAHLLKVLLKKFSVKNYFVFDMSIPSVYLISKYCKALIFAARHSEIEREPVLYKKAKWVWMDELGQKWIENRFIEEHVLDGKKVCIVSPELHGRPYEGAWAQYKKLIEKTSKSVYICTDFPDKADKFFNEG